MVEPVAERIAIIGAGVAGLALGGALHEAGLSVTVFSRERHIGGRLATRYYHGRFFDHGTPYIRPHSRRGAVLFSEWRKAGVIRPWRAEALEFPSRKRIDTTSWHVAIPHQSSLAAYLAEPLNVRTGFELTEITGDQRRWHLKSKRGETVGEFATVLFACPLEFARPLLEGHPHLLPPQEAVRSEPCLVTMVEFDDEVLLEYEAAFFTDNALGWVCRDSAKPGRDSTRETWVLRACREWSREQFHATPERIASLMLSEFSALCPVEPPTVTFCRAHRWRYSNQVVNKGIAPSYDRESGLGLFCNQCGRSDVDAIYLDARDFAKTYLESR